MDFWSTHFGLWPLAVYSLIVFLLISFMIGFSYILGERHRDRTTQQPYESGIISSGPVRARIDIRFYLLAVFFVIFDLEAVFVFAWAIAVRETGWLGFIEISIFIAFLLAALVYLWRIGALNIETSRQMKDRMKIKKGSSDFSNAS